MTLKLVREAVLFGVIGLALGFAQLLSLRAIVRTYVAGHSSIRAFGLHLGRMAATVVVWVIVCRTGGAVGLLAGFAGFLVARPLVMARLGKGAP